MIDLQTYPAFSAYPATGAVTGPARLTVDARTTRVSLTGEAFTARVEISNAANVTAGETPPTGSWSTYGPLTAAAPIIDVPGPAKHLRVVLQSGTVTAGTIEADGRASPRVQNDQLLPLVQDRIDEIAENAIGTLLDPQLTPVRDDVALVKGALNNAALASLGTKNSGAGRQWVDGSSWVWASGGTVDGGTVVNAHGGGVWVRERTPRTWNAAHFRTAFASTFNGDWGACLSHIVTLMQDGDTLLIPPGQYPCGTTVHVPVPITIQAEGAELILSHNQIGLDLKPGLGRLYVGEDATRPTYRGTLPAVKGAGDYYNENHIGVRVANAYWPDLTLQRVEECGIGMQVYANAAAAAGRDVGTTYSKFKLERLLNLVNLDFIIAPNPGGQPGRNYVTQNQFYGGSFTGAGVTHVRVRGSTIPGLIDNTTFYGTSFEGNPRYVFDFDGHVDGFKGVGGCRLETGDGLEAVVKFGPNTYSCELKLDGFATPSRILLIQDQGKWNRVMDNKWPYGYVEYYDGVYYLDRPGSGAPAPANWVPRSLDTQPWEETIVTQGQTKVLDLNYRRRWVVTYTGTTLAANQIQFTGAPDVSMDFEIDLDLVQSGSGVTGIDAAWFANFNMGADAPAPNRLFKRDRYRLRRMNGLWAIIAHTAT